MDSFPFSRFICLSSKRLDLPSHLLKLFHRFTLRLTHFSSTLICLCLSLRLYLSQTHTQTHKHTYTCAHAHTHTHKHIHTHRDTQTRTTVLDASLLNGRLAPYFISTNIFLMKQHIRSRPNQDARQDVHAPFSFFSGLVFTPLGWAGGPVWVCH